MPNKIPAKRIPAQDLLKKAKVRPMKLEDIPTVLAIEQVSFPTPWTAESFISEL